MKRLNQWAIAKTTKIAKATTIAALVLTSSVSFADEQVAPWLKIGADINVDASGKNTNDYEANLKIDAALRFEIIVREGIKAVVKARIEQELMKDGKGLSDTQKIKLEKAIEQAYIQIELDKISGMPRAILTVGKGEMAFGQDVLQLPMFRDSLLYNFAKEREVIGVTVELPTNFLKVIDSVAISLYESGAGDFKMADGRGVSVQLSKRLTDQIQAQVSALVKDDTGFDGKDFKDREKRASFGFVFNSSNGQYKIWTQGLVFDKNPNMPTTDYGAQVGGSMKLGPGDVVVDYQYLQNFAQEYSAAYNLPVNSWLVISPQVTYQRKEDGDNSTRIGLRARVSLDQAARRALKTQP
jgi:hypothetical protein